MNQLPQDTQLLQQCRRAWDNLHSFRRRRQRFKDFTFGSQWGDTHRLPSGRFISEEQTLLSNGRLPITNNLIRQLVKSIVGRFRCLHPLDDLERDNADAATFQEFLISGCALQRIDEHQQPEPFSPARLFFLPFRRTDAADCTFIGLLHDMPLTEILRRFGDGTPQRIEQIRSLMRSNSGIDMQVGELTSGCIEFSQPVLMGTHRIIEVWRKTCAPVLQVHDPSVGSLKQIPYSEQEYRDCLAENGRRGKAKEELMKIRVITEESWQHIFLTPRGHVLQQAQNSAPSLVLTMYPMIDGEVHSLVEDVIGQQKYVNRLITLLDDVIASSAKGAILYPSDQLPPGMGWDELARLWASPGGIIPFRRTSKTMMPVQLQSSGTAPGATEMLKIQLELFHEISGTSNTLKFNNNSAEGMKIIQDEITVSITDMVRSFLAFRQRRDQLLSPNKDLS